MVPSERLSRPTIAGMPATAPRGSRREVPEVEHPEPPAMRPARERAYRIIAVHHALDREPLQIHQVGNAPQRLGAGVEADQELVQRR
jgi:hypothetical protein